MIAEPRRLRYPPPMASQIDPPEISYVTTNRVACDGATDISPALGHPRVYLQIDDRGYTECGYCDKRFVLKGGPADRGEPDPAQQNK
jgi:uncharacterized Zn-finger protein